MSRFAAHRAPAAPARRSALLAALLATLLLVVAALPATAAQALLPGAPRPATIDPAAITELRIHKFEQPPTAGAPVDGLPQDTTGLVPVPGATFTAKRVPGFDLTNNAGQAAAAALAADQAAALVAAEPVAASGTTDGAGDATLAPLGVGLYYVEETVTPTGFLGAEAFLVALPLTDPQTLSDWLTTVHVYPKNARASIALDVVDQDAVKLGDVVRWTSRSDIPNHSAIDGYRIVQRIDPNLQLIDDGSHIEVGFDAPGAPPLLEGTHYTRTVDPATNTVTIDFTAAGRAALEAVVQAHPGARVTVGYRTRVLGEGELVNEALLYPSRASIDGDPGAPAPLSAKNTTKWGPLTIVVHERGRPANLIAGAKFKLYLTAQDAVAGTNPIVIDGVGEWTTGQNGELAIHGLRLSGFVNGLDRDPDDPLFRPYFAMPTSFPSGWAGVKEPLRAIVFSTTDAQVLTVVLWKSAPGGGDLAVTGAQVTGLVLLGGVLLGLGALLLARRRRREQEPAAP